MAFFNKTVPHPQARSNGSDEAISTVISKDMSITGEISFTGKARIDGTINGNIKGEHLILSESGKIHGDIDLTSLICYGSIEGNIKAKDVNIHAAADLKVKLESENLSVEPGAKLSGEISSVSPQKQIKPAAVQPADNKKTS
ncbi:MAG: polymer-forming cytoskeletal protein [Desulfobulbaceae bacterium]|nr:polymer-forming cytoskeletal protein [Desulfobulbaceae bacterium]